MKTSGFRSNSNSKIILLGRNWGRKSFFLVKYKGRADGVPKGRAVCRHDFHKFGRKKTPAGCGGVFLLKFRRMGKIQASDFLSFSAICDSDWNFQRTLLRFGAVRALRILRVVVDS